MTSLSPPTSLRLLRAGPHKDGRWINVLQWDASQNSEVSYLVMRRYRHAPMNFGDGKTLGKVFSNRFVDFNPEVGNPTFYTVYPCIGKEIGREGCTIYAGLRPEDVSHLRTIRTGPHEVRLTWELPFNAVDCTVRKTTSLSKVNRFKGPTVEVEDIHSGTIDRKAGPSQHLYYVVFCTFYDFIKSAYVYSTGVQVHVLPYGEMSDQAVDPMPQQLAECAYCGGPLLAEEKCVVCMNCNAPHAPSIGAVPPNMNRFLFLRNLLC
jgi:hypothetical protein